MRSAVVMMGICDIVFIEMDTLREKKSFTTSETHFYYNIIYNTAFIYLRLSQNNNKYITNL